MIRIDKQNKKYGYMANKYTRRKYIFWLTYLVGCITTIANYYPDERNEKYTVSGYPTTYSSGSRANITTLQVDNVVLVCTVSVFGSGYGCPYSSLNKEEKVEATYYKLRMANSVFSSTNTTSVLLLLKSEQGYLYSIDFEGLIRRYIINSVSDFLFISIFLFPITRVRYFSERK